MLFPVLAMTFGLGFGSGLCGWVKGGVRAGGGEWGRAKQGLPGPWEADLGLSGGKPAPEERNQGGILPRGAGSTEKGRKNPCQPPPLREQLLGIRETWV